LGNGMMIGTSEGKPRLRRAETGDHAWHVFDDRKKGGGELVASHQSCQNAATQAPGLKDFEQAISFHADHRFMKFVEQITECFSPCAASLDISRYRRMSSEGFWIFVQVQQGDSRDSSSTVAPLAKLRHQMRHDGVPPVSDHHGSILNPAAGLRGNAGIMSERKRNRGLCKTG
jgi:hypothetical protein